MISTTSGRIEWGCRPGVRNVGPIGEIHRLPARLAALRPVDESANFITSLIDQDEQFVARDGRYCVHKSARANIVPSSISPAVPRPVGRSSG